MVRRQTIPKPMLTYCLQDPQGQTSFNFESSLQKYFPENAFEMASATYRPFYSGLDVITAHVCGGYDPQLIYNVDVSSSVISTVNMLLLYGSGWPSTVNNAGTHPVLAQFYRDTFIIGYAPVSPHLWWLECQKQVSRTCMSNYSPHYAVRCNYLSVSQ